MGSGIRRILLGTIRRVMGSHIQRIFADSTWGLRTNVIGRILASHIQRVMVDSTWRFQANFIGRVLSKIIR